MSSVSSSSTISTSSSEIETTSSTSPINNTYESSLETDSEGCEQNKKQKQKQLNKNRLAGRKQEKQTSFFKTKESSESSSCQLTELDHNIAIRYNENKKQHISKNEKEKSKNSKGEKKQKKQKKQNKNKKNKDQSVKEPKKSKCDKRVDLESYAKYIKEREKTKKGIKKLSHEKVKKKLKKNYKKKLKKQTRELYKKIKKKNLISLEEKYQHLESVRKLSKSKKKKKLKSIGYYPTNLNFDFSILDPREFQEKKMKSDNVSNEEEISQTIEEKKKFNQREEERKKSFLRNKKNQKKNQKNFDRGLTQNCVDLCIAFDSPKTAEMYRKTIKKTINKLTYFVERNKLFLRVSSIFPYSNENQSKRKKENQSRFLNKKKKKRKRKRKEKEIQKKKEKEKKKEKKKEKEMKKKMKNNNKKDKYKNKKQEREKEKKLNKKIGSKIYTRSGNFQTDSKIRESDNPNTNNMKKKRKITEFKTFDFSEFNNSQSFRKFLKTSSNFENPKEFLFKELLEKVNNFNWYSKFRIVIHLINTPTNISIGDNQKNHNNKKNKHFRIKNQIWDLLSRNIYYTLYLGNKRKCELFIKDIRGIS
ncbi:hypothetical protein M0812_01978 [Anaeramoeba flamelloides]|uniref:Uncharacterized protein n=1 Tax=Anaeramoeba flamelloides TaxID=1746091 RepID=A0AAV7Z1J7_9EUKA|nr:hypothetical protein M0812_01978 [Anaeramoeba flamelloides]